MKSVVVRLEDHARAREHTPALLEGAKAAHLHHLAQAGAAGLIRPPAYGPSRESRARARRGDAAIGRFSLQRALLGLGTQDLEAAPGLCAAAGVNVELAPEDSAWCCELVTQHEGTIVDPTAGAIPTKESAVLMQALNDRLESDRQRWEVGDGAHHLLVLDDPGLAETDWRSATQPPELLVGRAWKRSLPRGESGQRLAELIEHASGVLDDHPINRVRIDLGENPANLAWLWGGAQARPQRSLKELTGRSAAVLSNNVLLRGLARLLGLDWKPGPASLEEAGLCETMERFARLADRHDLVAIHLEITLDDPIERQCAMERIDQLLLKPATDLLSRQSAWRLAAIVDDRRLRGSIPVVAIGSDLPSQPVLALTDEHLAASPLVFDDGAALFAWLMQGAAASVA